MMPPAMSMEPLIPLPNDSGVMPQHDDKDDIFATLFSPATPRASPTLRATTTDDRDVERIRPRMSHNRTASIDSDFGSFVSVPSAEDPLHQLSESGGEAFTPLQNFDFFDRFTEEAKVATEKNKQGILEELLRHEEDPLYFLQGGTSICESRLSLTPHTPAGPGTPETTPHTGGQEDVLPVLISLAPDGVPSSAAPLSNPFRQAHSPYSFEAEGALESTSGSGTPSTSSTPAAQSTPQPMLRPSSGLLHELLQHEDDPMYFHSAGSARSSRTPTPQPQERKSRHPTRESIQTEPHLTHAPGPPGRSPSLPPSPNRMSTPEVQRAQSFFMPTSFTTSSFPTKWVSSLLSRPTPPLSPPPVTRASLDHPITHGRAATTPGDAAISHGTPFAAQPFVAPSGAPGFAGDRTWNKGFEFDKGNVERASVRLAGRKESTTAVLTGPVADQLRPHLPALKRLSKSWSLLYSLDQDGISLNTLYTRCEAYAGGALVVMRDSNEALFGAWMGEGIHMSKGAYYGSGESFLWKVTSEERLRVFKWTGRNEYVALCEPEYISFGGGDGHYGLYLDETLSDGSSAPCLTFDNEPLCSAGPRQGEGVTFECVGLEVWGIGG